MINLRVSKRKYLFITTLFFLILMVAVESVRQWLDSRYVRSIAWEVVQKTHTADPRSRVIALRDYLRANVSFQGLPSDGRPFLRDGAADTLRSRRGYCGEVSRTFICLASALGIRAQRINLYGKLSHVVAEAEIGQDDKVIVDCQNPPEIADLEPLDKVILRPEYDDYYTLNLRRLHLTWLVSRVKMEMGPFTYWIENPHALKALLWSLPMLMMLALWGMRRLVRFYLLRRGWIHISNLTGIQKPVILSQSGQTGAHAILSAPARLDSHFNCDGETGTSAVVQSSKVTGVLLEDSF